MQVEIWICELEVQVGAIQVVYRWYLTHRRMEKEAEREQRRNELAADNQEADAADGDDCCVCMERCPQVVFLPCGHKNCCLQCAQQVCACATTEENRLCPVCRGKIESVRPISED